MESDSLLTYLTPPSYPISDISLDFFTLSLPQMRELSFCFYL